MTSRNPLTRGKKQQALALLKTGQLDEARSVLEKVCAADRRDAEAWWLLGMLYERMGTLTEAEKCYHHAREIEPVRAEIHFALGNVQQAMGNAQQAINSYRQALAIRPDFLEAQGNLGAVLESVGRLDEAAQSFERTLALDPARAETHYNLANVLRQLERHDEAIHAYRKAISRQPHFAAAWINLGVALTAAALSETHSPRRLDMLGEAAAAVGKGLALKPDVADTHNNLAGVLRNLGRFEDAAGHYRLALALDPGHQDAHEGLATVALLLGRFAEGWEHYRHRVSMRIPGAVLPPPALPSDLTGLRLLVVRDQGLGDEIFFLRFAARLKERGAALMYRPDPRLAAILSRTNIIDRILGPDDVTEADYTCSAGDLPWLLGMRERADMPPPLALPPLSARHGEIRARLARIGPPPYLGVTWRAGDKSKARVLYKECPLADLARVLRQVPGTVLVLQRNPLPGEIEQFTAALGRAAHDLSALNDDLESMLALLSLIDDYVGVSNTNMHLRAGVGKTARVLVPAPPEWRWMAEGRESPWFPGFSVYRQGYDGRWEETLVALQRDLKQRMTHS